MTLAKVNNPSLPIDPEALDEYLAKGWFRMGQTIFTTHILHYDHRYYSAIWLRIPLVDYVESNTFKKLKKTNAGFKIIFQPATLNEEKEALFQKYKTAVSFEASASLESLLFGKTLELSIYNTIEVLIYDHNRLIAVGFFDIGQNSAAGISSFYDPEYKKHSLGKFLIYQKIEYCKAHGMDWFYPGYFVPGYAVFDYKLNIVKESLQYFSLQGEEWLPIQQFSATLAPLEMMKAKLEELSKELSLRNIHTSFFHYEFYNANLTPEFKGLELFDYPVFLYCFPYLPDLINPIIIFEVSDQQFHLVRCESLFKTDTPFDENENYATNLLRIRQFLYSNANVQEIANQLSIWVEAIRSGQ